MAYVSLIQILNNKFDAFSYSANEEISAMDKTYFTVGFFLHKNKIQKLFHWKISEQKYSDFHLHDFITRRLDKIK